MSVSGRETGELVTLAREGRMAAFVDRALVLPPADLGEVLSRLPDRLQLDLVQVLPARLAARALIEMAPAARPEALLARLDSAHGASLLAELEDDDAADLLGRLTPEQRQPILAYVDDASALGRLLGYPVTSAGGLMTSRLVIAHELDTVGFALESVRRQTAAVADLTEVFVIDTARRLTGVLSLQEILLAPPASQVRDVMSPATHRVRPGDDQTTVAGLIARYGLTSVPVVDGGGRLLGRVTADDARDAAANQAVDGLLRFGGVSIREAPAVPWTVAVRSRLPSLYVNLVTAFGAAAVVYFFQGTVQRMVTLAVWMPVVAGVGGNAGTQSLAASIRRLLARTEPSSRLRALVLREALIGAANGLAIG
ncbi:MAG: magnesium transporter, partial [Gemmatimonadales bacterium]